MQSFDSMGEIIYWLKFHHPILCCNLAHLRSIQKDLYQLLQGAANILPQMEKILPSIKQYFICQAVSNAGKYPKSNGQKKSQDAKTNRKNAGYHCIYPFPNMTLARGCCQNKERKQEHGAAGWLLANPYQY